MKTAEFEKLPVGQLVRIRAIGAGSRQPGIDNEIIVARIATADRWAIPQGGRSGYLYDRLLTTFEGLGLNGRGSIAPTGTHRLVVVERLLPIARELDPQVDPWIRNRTLQLVGPRDVISLWSEEMEAEQLAERQTQQDAAVAARLRAVTQQLAQQAEQAAILERVRPILEAVGVDVQDHWARTGPRDRLFSLNVLADVIELLATQDTK